MYVGRAIDSVLNQTFKDFEVLVVDDGSTDKSWDVISAYGDKIRAFRWENQGAGRACIKAAALARGKYIQIVDSDDELKPDSLEKVARHLGGSPSKIQFTLTPIDANGAVIGGPFPAFRDPYTRERMMKEIERNGSYVTGPTSSIVYRADVVAAVDDVDYERFLDGVTYLLCPFMGDIVTLQEPLANYRVHSQNASGFNVLSPDKIALERSRFIARLSHLKRICARLGIDASRVPEGEKTWYVTERSLLWSMAKDGSMPFAMTVTYLVRLSRAMFPLKYKLASGAWAIAAFLVPGKGRKTLLNWRYNPWSRPSFLRGVTRTAAG